MTLPNLTSPTAELEAIYDRLREKIRSLNARMYREQQQHDQIEMRLIEILDELNRRESCTHEDFTENLEGRKCRTCGLETK